MGKQCRIERGRQHRRQAMNCLPKKPPEMTAEVFIDNYFNFSGANPERGDCDFLVCVYRSNERDTFYVIPYEDMPREGAKIKAVDHDGVSLDN